MNPLIVIQVVTALAQLTKQVMPLIEEVRGDLSSNDEAALQAALADMAVLTDALRARTSANLRG